MYINIINNVYIILNNEYIKIYIILKQVYIIFLVIFKIKFNN